MSPFAPKNRLLGLLRANLARLRLFGLVGVAGFLVDAAVLAALTNPLWLGLGPIPARLASFAVAVTVTWRLNRRITFVDRRSASQGVEFLRYLLANGTGASINMAIYLALTPPWRCRPSPPWRWPRARPWPSTTWRRAASPSGRGSPEMVPRKLAGIEAARGIAALGVVLFHATMTMGPDASGALPLHGLFAFSYLGVEFFFVLSGFMVWYAHGKLLDRPDRLGEFLWRRAARIYPTLWVVLVAAVLAWEILAALGLPRHDWRTEGGWRLLATILAWPVTTPPHLLNVVWTLPLEILFYLIFAVGIWNRRLGLMVLGGWQAMILAANLFWTTDPDSFLWRINHLDFGLGILAAVALASRPPARPLTLAAAGATLLLAAGLAADFGLIGQATRGLKVFTGLCSAAIVLGLVEAERRGRLGTPAPLVRLGAASYSVFLVHLMAIHLFLALAGLCAWTRSLPRDALFLGAVVAAIGFGLLFWRFVETPLVHFFASITIGRPARRTS